MDRMAKTQKSAVLSDTDYAELERYVPGGGGVSLFYRPQLGEDRKETKQQVRIVPASPQFVHKSLHYFGTYPNSEGGVCPGHGCPACELNRTLYPQVADLPRNHPTKEAVSSVRAQIKVYTPVYIPKEDRFAVWSMGSGGENSVFARVQDLIVKNKAKKPLSAETGRNILFVLTPSGKWHRYAGFELAERPSKLPKDWREKVPDVAQAADQRVWSIEELQALLEEHVPELLRMAKGGAPKPRRSSRRGKSDPELGF